MSDNLMERFAALEQDVTARLTVTPAAHVRARGDRHRVRIATTSVLTVTGLTALGAAAGASALGALSQSSNTPGGRAAPSASVPTMSPSSPALTRIPTGLRLPHEGEKGWVRDTSRTAAAVFTGCQATDPTQVGRVDARTLRGRGPAAEEQHSPTVVTEQFFVYDSVESALSVYRTLEGGTDACGWTNPHMNDDQLAGSKLTGSYPNATLERVHGVLLGNTIFLVHTVTTGSLMSSVGGAEVSTMVQRLCEAARLCTFGPGLSLTPSPFPSSVGTPSPGFSSFEPTANPSVFPSANPSVSSPGTPTPAASGSSRTP